MKNPLLTVIIPAYNCEKYITGAIDSCLTQEYDNVEVIVVDDGSSDGTASRLDKYVNNPQVVVLRQTNSGVSAARNNGLAHASGKYITFLDGDDQFGADTFGPNIELMEANTDVSWLLFPVQRINMKGEEVDRIASDLMPSYKYRQIQRLEAYEAFQQMDSRHLPVCVCGGIFTLDFFDSTFVSGRFEDTIMVMNLLRKKPHLIVSPKGSYRYYDREGSFINAQWDSEKWESYTRVLLKTMDTRLALVPKSELRVEHERTRLYYNLLYLKDINHNDNSFNAPLELFLSEVNEVKPSIYLWTRYKIKTWIKNLQKSVMAR